MKINKTLGLLVVYGMLLGTVLMATDTAVSNFSEKRTFEGSIEFLEGGPIQYGFNDSYRGYIDYTPPVGTLFKGPICDINGKVIREGDVLIHIEPSYRIAMVQQSQAAVDLAVTNLEYAAEQWEIAQKLLLVNAMSKLNYFQAKQGYFGAIASLESAKAALKQAQCLLDVCTYRAQYAGIITKVMVPSGYCAGELSVMEIYEICPIGIKVKLNKDLIGQINYNTPITIYPSRKGGKPAGIIRGYVRFAPDGIIFPVFNKILPPPVNANKDGKSIPVFERWGLAVVDTVNTLRTIYHPADQLMLVQKKSILKDDKGYYVWRLKNARDITADKGMSYVSPVEKIYINVGNFQVYTAAHTEFIATEPDININEGDVFLLAEDVPEGLKDGDEVCIYSPIYTFMPSDIVKVEIGPNPPIIQ